MNYTEMTNDIRNALIYSVLDGGWMFRAPDYKLYGPYTDMETAYAAALLVYGKNTRVANAIMRDYQYDDEC